MRAEMTDWFSRHAYIIILILAPGRKRQSVACARRTQIQSCSSMAQLSPYWEPLVWYFTATNT